MSPAFQYSGYQNPYAGTIAEILQHQGDIRARQALTVGEAQARAAEQSGQAWGSAIGSIGQSIAAIPQQIQQAKTQQQQQEVLGLTLQQKRREIETAARVDDTKQRISAMMQDPSVFNPDGTLNTKSILASLQQVPGGGVGPTRPVDVGTVMGLIDPINESLTAARKAKLDWDERRTNAIARMAQGIKTLGAPTPDNPQGTYLQHAEIGIASALKSGIFTPDEATQVIAGMHAQPEVLPQMLDQMIAASTLPPIKLTRGETLVNPLDPSKTLATNLDPREAETARHNQAMEAISQQVAGRAEAAQAETARHNQAMEGLTAKRTDAMTNALSPDAVQYAGTQYRVTGQMPALGMGNAQARAAILNEAALQTKHMGQSPVQAIQKQAAYKADATALTQMRKMSSSAEAFETKALQQADIVVDLSNKVARTQYPIINSALLRGEKIIAGDQNTQLLYNALTTFTTEYAKIMEGSTGSVAASSESARKAAAELIAPALNKGTLAATVDLMRREMRLTIQGYDATIGHITERMGGAAPAPAPVGATPIPVTPKKNPFRP